MRAQLQEAAFPPLQQIWRAESSPVALLGLRTCAGGVSVVCAHVSFNEINRQFGRDR